MRRLAILTLFLLLPAAIESSAKPTSDRVVCTNCHHPLDVSTSRLKWEKLGVFTPLPTVTIPSEQVKITTQTTKVTKATETSVTEKVVAEKKTVITSKVKKATRSIATNSRRSNQIKQAFLTGKIQIVRGDTLNGLASQGWGASRLWKELAKANGISTTKPRLLQISETLIVPDVGQIEVRHHLTSPYKAKAEQGSKSVLAAIDQAFYSEPIKTAMKQKVETTVPVAGKVEKEEIVDCISSGKTGVNCNPLAGYKFSWLKISELKAMVWDEIIAEGQKCYIKIIDLCGNFNARCVPTPPVKLPPPVVEPVVPPLPVFPPISTAKLPPLPVFPPISTAKLPPLPPVPLFPAPKPVHTKFEMYVGAGYYEAEGKPQSDGSFYWLKARWRPLEYAIRKKVSGALGVFGFLAGGFGHDDDAKLKGNSYDYSWTEGIVGPTNKLYGTHWDMDTDLGIGRLRNDGGNKFVKNHQIDNIYYIGDHVNLYPRRDAGKKWFPKTELNFEYRKPFQTDKNHNGSPATDNTAIEGTITQSIYDFDLSKDYKLTPGVNLGAGHDYGLKQDFLKFGPEVKLSYSNDDLVGVDFLNWKQNLGGARGQWQWIGGFLSVHGLWKVAYQSMIHEVPPESVPSLTGSLPVASTPVVSDVVNVSATTPVTPTALAEATAPIGSQEIPGAMTDLP